MSDYLRDAALLRDEDRSAGLDGLQGSDAEGLGNRRHDIEVSHPVCPFNFLSLEEARKQHILGDAELSCLLDDEMLHVPLAREDELDIGIVFKHPLSSIEEIVRPLLQSDAAKKQHYFFPLLRKLGCGQLLVNGIVHDADFPFRDAVMPHNHVFCVVAHRNDRIGFLHAPPLDVIDMLVDTVASGAVEFSRVDMDD